MSTEQCINCKKPFPTSGKFKYYGLWGKFQGLKEMACEDCWNKNQDQYEQDKKYDYIWESVIDGSNEQSKPIWTSCEETGCTKRYDPWSIEALRHNTKCPFSKHNLKGGSLTFDQHKDLNKNPKPVNSLEELVKQWMANMEYKKVYFKNNEIKIVDKNGKESEVWLIGVATKRSFWGELAEWLKTQPNQEIVREGNYKKDENNSPDSNFLLTLSQYYTANDIKSIEKQSDGNLLIKFNNGTTSQINPTDSSTNQEQRTLWENFQNYLNSQGISSLSKEKLQELTKQNSQGDKKDWTPWVVGGSIFGVLTIIGGIVWLTRRNKY